MKNCLIFLSFLFTSLTVSATDYYWVGGSGSWSEFATHWATTSGGSTFHTTVPTEFDHVYFDANSFDAADQIMTIDVEAFCNNMDWTGVTNSPEGYSFGTSIVLNVYGSFTLSDDMTWSHRNIDFESSNTGNTISTGLTSNFTTSANFYFRGSGEWILQDSLEINEIQLYNGTFDFNDQYVDAFSLYPRGGSSVVDLSGSEIHTVNFRNTSFNPAAVLPGTSTLYVSNSFYAGGSTFNEVVLTEPLVAAVSCQDDATIASLTLVAGANVKLESGTTITVTDMVIAGTKEKGIELYAGTPGSAATISQPTGTVNGEYLILQDIAATGGATFNAANSLDNGNNTGWTITAPVPLDYYWVGNDGNWSDYTNHWATTSGGVSMHTGVPGLLDNVYFDANSFDALSTVTIDINANCADMDWAGLDSEVTLTKLSIESLSIYGSLTMHSSVTSSLGDLYFKSEDLAETITTSNSYLANKIWFTGTGGWTLMDSVEASNLEISSGSLDLNDQVLDLASRFDVGSASPKTMNFGSSTIYTNDYFYTASGLTLEAGTSTLVFQGTGSNMRGNGSGDIMYNNVVIEGTTMIDFHDHTFNSLEVKPGATLKMGAGDILTVGSLTGAGTSISPITIVSDAPGTQAILTSVSGTQEVTYAALQDINATGGATFNAYSSTDNGNNTGWNFLADIIAPSFISAYPSIGTIGGSQVSINVQLDEPATLYSVTLASSATAPTAAQIIAGTDASDATVASESLFISEANVTTELVVTGLMELDSYDLYFALKDEADNIQSTVAMLDITTIDDSAPVFVDSYPKISLIEGTTLGFSVSIQESGTVYYILLADGSTTPSSAQVKAGNDASDGAAISFGNASAMLGEVYDFEFTGLTETTAYDIYIVAEDANGNLSATAELLESTTIVDPLNYYWVGGSGSWSEYATHWATTSGGTTFHTEVPTEFDHVFFDANSFDAADQIMTIDVEAFCNNMDWTGVTNSPEGYSFGTSIVLNVYGSFTLSDDMTWSHRNIDFESTNTGNTISTGRTSNVTDFENFDFRGSGSWILQDSLVIREINTQAGTLDLNDQYVEVFSFYLNGASSAVEMRGSDVYTINFRNNTGNPAVVLAGTSTLHVSNSFYAGGSTYNQVVLSKPLNTNIFHEGDAIINTLTFAPGTNVRLESGSTMTVTELVAVGTKEEGIGLYVDLPGTLATLNQATGTVNGQYLTMKDIAATGGATFNAYASTDNGNNVGWNFLKLDQTITFDALADKAYDDLPFELAATTSSDLELSYISSDELVATVSGSTITIVGVGTTTITASQVGDDNFNAATSVEQTLTVNKADQSITFEVLTGKTFGDASFALEATGGGSGNAITFVSSDESVATVTGTTVTIIGAGTTTITASQIGNDNFNAATDQPQDLVVEKADQSITFEALSTNTFGDAPFNLEAAGGESGNSITYVSSDESVATIAGTTVTIVGAGTTTITASQVGDNNYNAATAVEQLLTVNKADQLITFEALEPNTFGDAEFELEATGGESGNAITFVSSDESVVSIAGTTVTIVGAGTTTITASQVGDNNYNAATAVEQLLTVNKADQLITFEALEPNTFGDAEFELEATGGESGNVITFVSSDESVVTVAGTTVTIVGAGTTTITASQAGDNNFNAAIDQAQELAVNKADQSVIFDELADVDISVGIVSLSATASSELGVVFSLVSGPATISGTDLTLTGEGTIVVTASQAGDANYNAASDVIRNFNVTDASKQDQTITFEALVDKTFGEGVFELTATASSNLAVSFSSSNEEVATVSGSTVTIVGAGTSTITAFQIGDDTFNPATAIEQVLTVNKADQVISFDALAAITFGDPEFDLIATGGASGNAITFVSSDESVAIVAGSTVTVIGAGATTITASQAGNNNYNAATDQPQDLIVNKADQAITFSALDERTFGDATFDLVAIGGESGNAITFTSSDQSVATVVGSTVTIVGAGTTSMTASQAGNDNYNGAENQVQELVVNKADQSITFDALDDVDISVGAVSLSASSSSALAVAFSLVSGPATISGSDLTLTGTGTVSVSASQAGNANYNEAPEVLRIFNVSDASKQDQTITFEALADKTFGDASFELTATASSSLAVSFSSSDEAVATVSGSTVTIVGAGTTTIIASQTGDDSFNPASVVEQPLTVSKSDQVISFEALATKTFGDSEFDLEATSSAALGVSYSSSDELVATVSGSTVTIVGAGTTTITATQAGNNNYTAAVAVEQQLTVNKADQVITIAPITDKEPTDVAFDAVATVDSGLDLTYEISGPATISGVTITLDGSEGIVTVTVSQGGDVNHNSASESITFNVASALGVGNSLGDLIKIYPNPVVDYITIDTEKLVNLKFFGLNGQLIKELNQVNGKVDISSLKVGTYIMEVSTKEDRSTLRIHKTN